MDADESAAEQGGDKMDKSRNRKAPAWALELADMVASGHVLYTGEQNWRTVSAGPGGIVQEAVFPVCAQGERPQDARLEVLGTLVLGRPRPVAARPKMKGEVRT
jgi:hypothetical protein